ncbi:glycosyltransferase family 4 protein [candidate division WOR-3 bacterium]|nr:glycosyltransferase family 4 protein [candidate division WOR-3 bacterium]
MVKRIAFIHEEVDAYRITFFEKLYRSRNIRPTVFYCEKAHPHRGGRLTLGKSFQFSEILPGSQIKIPFLEREIKYNPRIWKRLSEGSFDYIIVGGYYHITMLLSILWALIHSVPYAIISESHLLNRRNIWKSLLKRLLLPFIIKHAAFLLPLGKLQAEYLIQYGAKAKDMYYFPNTSDVNFFTVESDKHRNRKKELKKELGIKSKYVVLYVGRLTKEKGLFTLLKAFKEIKRSYDNATLLIIGEGRLRNALENFINKKEIDNVLFKGFIENKKLPRYYAVSDVFVLPSRNEPWGVVVTEAMASALPLILSDKVGCRRDLLKVGKNGFCFEKDDPRQLASYIERFLENPASIKKMGNDSRNIIKKFDYSYCEKNLKNALGRR